MTLFVTPRAGEAKRAVAKLCRASESSDITHSTLKVLLEIYDGNWGKEI